MSSRQPQAFAATCIKLVCSVAGAARLAGCFILDSQHRHDVCMGTLCTAALCPQLWPAGQCSPSHNRNSIHLTRGTQVHTQIPAQTPLRCGHLPACGPLSEVAPSALQPSPAASSMPHSQWDSMIHLGGFPVSLHVSAYRPETPLARSGGSRPPSLLASHLTLSLDLKWSVIAACTVPLSSLQIVPAHDAGR